MYKRWQIEVSSISYVPVNLSCQLNVEMMRSTFYLQFTPHLAQIVSSVVETIGLHLDSPKSTVHLCSLVSFFVNLYLQDVTVYKLESELIADQHGLNFPFLFDVDGKLLYSFIKAVLSAEELSFEQLRAVGMQIDADLAVKVPKSVLFYKNNFFIGILQEKFCLTPIIYPNLFQS